MSRGIWPRNNANKRCRSAGQGTTGLKRRERSWTVGRAGWERRLKVEEGLNVRDLGLVWQVASRHSRIALWRIQFPQREARPEAGWRVALTTSHASTVSELWSYLQDFGIPSERGMWAGRLVRWPDGRKLPTPTTSSLSTKYLYPNGSCCGHAMVEVRGRSRHQVAWNCPLFPTVASLRRTVTCGGIG